ncbi:MAG: InlB B-repeat-containing protein, partial [Erysipelotrichaceae bacterium]|nr:InlB B-repeat-containing protein [Erysipelotrichaceae bacterium]
ATPITIDGYTYMPTYDNNGMKTISSGVVTADGTLVLKLYYTPYETNLTYKANGGIGEDVVENGVVDQVLTVKEGNIFTRAGYTFIGWNTSADGKGTAYPANSDYTLTVNDDILYAQWKANTNTSYSIYHYKVSVDGMSSVLVGSEQKTGTTGTTVTATPMTIDGYTYKKDFDSNGMKTIATGIIAGDGSLILKLYYIPNTVKLVYKANGGIGSDVTITAHVDDKYVISDNMFSRKGYTFVGWNTEPVPTGVGKEYMPKDNYIFTANDIVLYAQWKANSGIAYQVEHYKVNADGTSAKLEDTKTYYGTTDETVTATPITIDGYTYMPTYDNNGMKTISSGVVTADGTLVLKLYYTPYETNLTYKANGGIGKDVVENGVVDQVLTVKEGNIFTRAGYTFTGWNTSADGKGTVYAPDSKYTLTTNEDVLYAQWEKDPIVPPHDSTDTADTTQVQSWILLMIMSAVSVLFINKKRKTNNKNPMI